jgi:hypothetical protein
MSQLPDLKDYVRLAPVWASVVPGRTPVVQWHASKGGARTSALYTTVRTQRKTGAEEWDVDWVCSAPSGVAVINSKGDLVYVETYDVGDSASKYRDR